MLDPRRNDQGESVIERPNLTPDEIRGRQFSAVGRRGVDRAEVASFLAWVADAYAEMQARLRRVEGPPSFERLGHEAAALLEAAKQGAESMRAKAAQDAEAIARTAREEGERLRAQARADVEAIRAEAEAARAKAHKEATSVLEEAATEAERATREADLVARRMRNVTERQCAELLADTHSRRERLEAHEREIRRRIEEVERVFQEFRAEMEALAEGAETPEPDTVAVEERTEGAEPPLRVQVESVQPKPIFEPRPRR
jgi:DivIVA domain-containing protein